MIRRVFLWVTVRPLSLRRFLCCCARVSIILFYLSDRFFSPHDTVSAPHSVKIECILLLLLLLFFLPLLQERLIRVSLSPVSHDFSQRKNENVLRA